MAKQLLPSPTDSGSSENQISGSADSHEKRSGHGNRTKHGGQSSEGRARGPGILDPDGCLRALSQLPGMIALKYLTPAQANAMGRIYGVILQQHKRSHAREEEEGLAEAGLADLAREKPELLNLLAPFLSDAQIDYLMQLADAADEAPERNEDSEHSEEDGPPDEAMDGEEEEGEDDDGAAE